MSDLIDDLIRTFRLWGDFGDDRLREEVQKILQLKGVLSVDLTEQEKEEIKREFEEKISNGDLMFGLPTIPKIQVERPKNSSNDQGDDMENWIQEGDEVITPRGEVGIVNKVHAAPRGISVTGSPNSWWTDEELIRASDPLRVRVDSEQEARVVLDMAEQHGWVISTNFDHWELANIDCLYLNRGHVNTYCTNRDTTCRHGVPFSGRKSQIRKYLSYNSEEETMSDLTHEPDEHLSIKCQHCRQVVTGSDRNNPCPARQPAEDDDDGKGNVSREIAERFMGNESVFRIVEMLPREDETLKKISAVEQAIRDHCELSDEVCEWTYDQTHYKFDSSCGEGWQFQNGPEQVSDDWDFCPGCGDRIEITTDEGGFELGDVIYVKQKDTYHLVREPSVEFPVIGEDEEGSTWCEDGITYDIEKVGTFAPDDDALERVNPECNGSLFITDDKVLFDPLCRTEDIEFSGSELLFTDEGRGYQVQGAEATGIVLESFHQIAEVSDDS